MKRTIALLLLGLALTSACTTTAPPPPIEYLLQPALPTGERDLGNGQPVALGRLDIAPYLDRAGIVVETAEGRVTAAQGHRWAEPLDHALRRLLQVEIARESGIAIAPRPHSGGNAALVIDVAVHQFHGTENGVVTLVADWTVRSTASNVPVAHHQLVRQTRTDAAGYDALVRAHLVLAEVLAGAIARSLPEVGPAGVEQP